MRDGEREKTVKQSAYPMPRVAFLVLATASVRAANTELQKEAAEKKQEAKESH